MVCMFVSPTTAVQHERKPIVDKKEQLGATGGGGATNATGGGGGGSAGPGGSTANASGCGGNGSASSAAAATQQQQQWRKDFGVGGKVKQEVTGGTGPGMGMFPVAFNFTEFTNSLAQRGSECIDYVNRSIENMFTTSTNIAVLPNTFAADSFAAAAAAGAVGDQNANHIHDDESSMDGPKPPATHPSLLHLAPQQHQQQQQQQPRQSSPSSASAVAATAAASPHHPPGVVGHLLTGNSSTQHAENASSVLLQTATHQLINTHTLDILAHIELLAAQQTANSISGSSHTSTNHRPPPPFSSSDPDDSDGDPPAARSDDRANAAALIEADLDGVPASAAPLLSDADIAFTLLPPAAQLPAYLNAYYVCECGSRLLFLSVHWVKQVPAFRRMGDDAQQALLHRSWTALFVLGLAQCAGTLALPTIWRAMAAAIRVDVAEERSGGGGGGGALRCRALAEAVAELQACVQALVALRLDECEMAYVKLVALFGMGECPSLHISHRCRNIVVITSSQSLLQVGPVPSPPKAASWPPSSARRSPICAPTRRAATGANRRTVPSSRPVPTRPDRRPPKSVQTRSSRTVRRQCRQPATIGWPRSLCDCTLCAASMRTPSRVCSLRT